MVDSTRDHTAAGEVPPRSFAGDALPRDGRVIEIRVTELRQLFNAIDPSPFRRRDLDPRAEEFIVAWATDLPSAPSADCRTASARCRSESSTRTPRLPMRGARTGLKPRLQRPRERALDERRAAVFLWLACAVDCGGQGPAASNRQESDPDARGRTGDRRRRGRKLKLMSRDHHTCSRERRDGV